MFLGPDLPVGETAMYGFIAGLCRVASSFGINCLFERKSLTLFLVNGGYHTVQFAVIVLGLWR